MSNGINKVILIGNLGADPEFRANTGTNLCKVRVATTDSWRDRESGQMNERTEWHYVTAFGRTAEVMRDYLRQGSKVYIEGRIQTRKWQDEQGQDRYTTEIIANRMLMLDSSSSGGGGAPKRRDDGPAPQGPPSEPEVGPDLNDDIPF